MANKMEPITRKETYLAKAAGVDVTTPTPITREEMFLEAIAGAGVSPEAIAAAVTDYLDNHGITITEVDPTVPAWAKQDTKPTYTAAEVGALDVDDVDDAVSDALARSAAVLVPLTANNDIVSVAMSFAQIYALFASRQKAYFLLELGGGVGLPMEIGAIQPTSATTGTLDLYAIRNGVLYQVALAPADQSSMSGTLTTMALSHTDGTTFTPSVSAAGVISWSNDGGKQNPASVDLVSAVISALPSATGVTF